MNVFNFIQININKKDKSNQNVRQEKLSISELKKDLQHIPPRNSWDDYVRRSKMQK